MNNINKVNISDLSNCPHGQSTVTNLNSYSVWFNKKADKGTENHFCHPAQHYVKKNGLKHSVRTPGSDYSLDFLTIKHLDDLVPNHEPLCSKQVNVREGTVLIQVDANIFCNYDDQNAYTGLILTDYVFNKNEDGRFECMENFIFYLPNESLYSYSLLTDRYERVRKFDGEPFSKNSTFQHRMQYFHHSKVISINGRKPVTFDHE